ncbi:PREDICTED: transmembrane protein 161A isoform X2 [Nipponia nippon]|uniref:transmembrane protein 161A isoform X2 n=1 Tax=Nipponia nippon TaxID=128390 RepID=UPI000510FBFD|nr:PREDICTED: transmembrane protein 161A isoform X2 [Nipponia nippon]
MGVQVVVSLLAASIMQKMAPHCSFARWLLCNGSLRRYKHPSDEELCALAGKQRPKAKRDRRMNGMTDDKPLSVPRDIDLRLDTSPITAVDALGLASVSSNLESILKQRGWEWTLPLTKLAFKLGLVALCSFLGACLTFPGLRLAQTHLDALRMAADKPLTQVLLHVSFLAPVLVVVMWIKPISRDFLLHAPMGKQTVQIMSDSAYNTARLWTIVGLCLLRLAVTRHHLQAYLGLAERWVEQMRKEAGRIAVLEIQRKITRIYCYVSVVSLQYLGPVILTLHCTLLLKTLGHHSWGLYPEPPPLPPAATAAPPHPGGKDGEDVRAAVEQITGVLGGIFTPLFFRGLFAFLTWWVAACQVVTSLFGLYFHQYLAAS